MTGRTDEHNTTVYYAIREWLLFNGKWAIF